jgi:hypothetical protein
MISSQPASVSAPARAASGRRAWRSGLLAVGWFNLVSAVIGGIGLIVTNGMGMPLSWLVGSPFGSYLGPGLILLLIVGGTQALAVLLQHRSSPWYPAAAAVAGFGMVIWIVVELIILPGYSVLHTLYLAAGLLQLILVLLGLGVLPAGRARGED